MAIDEGFPYHPKMPPAERIDWQHVSYSYDEPSDTLFVHLFGRERGAVTVEGDGYVDLRVDPVTEEIVGFQIEYFLTEVVQEDPRFLLFADLANISEELLTSARSRISPERMKQVGVASLGELARITA